MRLKRWLPLLAAGTAVWYVRSVYRFRDPVRVPQPGPGTVLSPADGVVGFVRRVENGKVRADALNTSLSARDLLGSGAPDASDTPGVADGWLLGVVVGPLDVHYTYQPAEGPVVGVTHTGSRRNVALLDAASTLAAVVGQPTDLLGTRAALENERLSMTTRTPGGDVTVTLVAPGGSLNATSYLREGDGGRAGYKSAFLAGGGLVLLHLPAAFTPVVSVGERVQGALTVVGQA